MDALSLALVIAEIGDSMGLITPVLTSNYTAKASDSVILCDTTGGAFTVTFEASPNDRTVHFVKDYAGASTSGPITVAGGGHSLEDPQNLGNYAASEAIAWQGGCAAWIYDTALGRWICIGLA